jgi:hypothetical protein
MKAEQQNGPTAKYKDNNDSFSHQPQSKKNAEIKNYII